MCLPCVVDLQRRLRERNSCRAFSSMRRAVRPRSHMRRHACSLWNAPRTTRSGGIPCSTTELLARSTTKQGPSRPLSRSATRSGRRAAQEALNQRAWGSRGSLASGRKRVSGPGRRCCWRRLALDRAGPLPIRITFSPSYSGGGAAYERSRVVLCELLLALARHHMRHPLCPGRIPLTLDPPLFE